MRSHPRQYRQVDVFTHQPFRGNPVCVFLNGEGLSQQEMQQIARWTNLSETTFILNSKIADYKLRIFTPSEELPFAGHPTLGSAHAFAAHHKLNKSRLIQECAFGLVELILEGDHVSFILPKYTLLSEHIPKVAIENAIGVTVSDDCKLFDTGPHWIIAHCNLASELSKIKIDTAALLSIFANLSPSGGLTVYTDENNQVIVRTFFSANGVIIEDPVCGSGNAAVAAHIKETQRVQKIGKKYIAHQGQQLNRNGRISVEINEKISIGGNCLSLFIGIADV